MDDNRLVVELEAEDNTGPGIQSANANLGKFEAQAAKSARNASSAFDSSIVALSQNTDNVTRSALSAVERIEKQASTAGLGAVDKLRIQQQQLISQLGDNEAVIARVNAAYGKLIRTREEAAAAAAKERAANAAGGAANGQTTRRDSSFVQDAEHAAEAVLGLGAAYGVATTSAIGHATAGDRVLTLYRALRIAASPTLFTAYTLAAGGAAEALLKLADAEARFDERVAVKAAKRGTDFNDQYALELIQQRQGFDFGPAFKVFSDKGLGDLGDFAGTISKLSDIRDPIERVQATFKAFGQEIGEQLLPQLNERFAENQQHIADWGIGVDKIGRENLSEFRRDFHEFFLGFREDADAVVLASKKVALGLGEIVADAYVGVKQHVEQFHRTLTAVPGGPEPDPFGGLFNRQETLDTEAAFARSPLSQSTRDLLATAGLQAYPVAQAKLAAQSDIEREKDRLTKRQKENEEFFLNPKDTLEYIKERPFRAQQLQSDTTRIKDIEAQTQAQRDAADKAKHSAELAQRALEQVARYKEAVARYDQGDQPGSKLIELVARFNKDLTTFSTPSQRAGLSVAFRGDFARKLQTEEDEIRKQALDRENFYIKGIAEAWKEVNTEVDRYDTGIVEQVKKVGEIQAQISRVSLDAQRQGIIRQSNREERLAEVQSGPGHEGEAIALSLRVREDLAQRLYDVEQKRIADDYTGELSLVQQAQKRLEEARALKDLTEQRQNSEIDSELKIAQLQRQKEESARNFGEGLFEAAKRGSDGISHFFTAQIDNVARTVAGNAFAETFKGVSLHSNVAPESFLGKVLARTPFGPDQLQIAKNAQSKIEETNHLGDVQLDNGAVPVRIVGSIAPEGGSFRAQGISGVERLLGVAPFLANSIGRQADAALSAPIGQSTAVSSVFRPVSEGEASPFDDPLAGLPAGERSAAIASTLFGGGIPGIPGVGASGRLAGRLGAFGNSAIFGSISNAVSTDAIVGGSYLGGERSQSIANAVFGGDNGSISFPNIDSQDGSYPRFSAGPLGGALSSISGIVGGPGGTSGFAGPVSGLGGLSGLGGPLSRIGGIFGNHTPPIGTIDDTPAGLGGANFGGQYSGLLGGLGLSLGIGGLFAKQQTPFSSAQSVGGFGLSGASFASHLPLSGSALGGTGALGGALAGVGFGLTADGLRRGGFGGLGEDIGGGALIGAQFGGPIGALIGAGIGALAGTVRLFVKGKAEQVQEQVKQAYRLDISKAFAQQIADTADKQYGGSISVAIHSKPVMDLLFDYAQATGQNFGIRNQARASTLTQTTSGLYQQAIYENGKALSFAGLPVYGGVQTQTILPPQYGPTGTLLPYQQIPGDNYAVPFTSPSTGSTTLLPVSASGSPGSSPPVNVTVHNTISGDDVGDYLDGRTITTIANNPRAVQQASFDAGQGNYLRRQNFGAGLNPAELLS